MSRSTFAGFTIAQTALNASQSALQIAGQNIANVNTTGYTRQRVDIVSLNLNGSNYTTSNASSKIGYGVEVSSVSQIRDPFLDVQYRNQIAKAGLASASQEIYDQLADIFDETDTTALKTALSDLSSSLEDLSANVNSSEYDTIVRSRCQVLLSYIQQKADSLSTLREETISSLENTDIPAVNDLLSGISELNDAIWNSQIMGSPALELQDQRNSMLDALASYLPISVTYKEAVISGSTKLEYPVVKLTGSDGTTYNLTAGEHGENCASLSVEHNTDADGNEDGTVSISLVPASDFSSSAADSYLKTDITDNLKNGAIKGIVDMLNKSGELDNPTTDTRGIGYYEKVLDVFVQTFAETFNALNTNTSAVTGASSFPTSGTVSELTSTGSEMAEYSLDFSSASGNVLKNEKIKINGQTYTFGNGSNGTIAIGEDLNESLTNLATALNESSATLLVEGTDTAGSWEYDSSAGKLTWTSSDPVAAGTTLTSSSITAADGTSLSLAYKANPSNIKNYDLFATSDGSNTFTAGNIKISDDWMNNSISIIASQKENSGSTTNDNVLRMIDALSAERDFTYEYTYLDKDGNSKTGSVTFYSGNFSKCYSNIENTQGIDSASNSSSLMNYLSVLSGIEDNRDSVSGVSLDEEGINLLQYQRSYTAAARLMTTLDEALEILISSTGVVGR